MDDPRMFKPHTNDDGSAPPGAGSAAAWLAQCGMVRLLVVEKSSATRHENTSGNPQPRWRKRLRQHRPVRRSLPLALAG